MGFKIYAQDIEFAAATGDNVNVASGYSVFDNPPSSFTDLVITTQDGDPEPRFFEVGDSYSLSWSGGGGASSISDATVVRSDLAPNGGGVIVFEGLDENGELAHIVWAPDFDLESWYWDNYNPYAEPQFHVVDQDASYTHGYICFARETRISTAMGGIPAGDLWEGDLIDTLDAGPQPVVQVLNRVVRGVGANAPVLFTPGAIGNYAPLRLSQQHRVMLRTPMAELMFGAPEVLVPAKALVNGRDICFAPCERVEYVHLLLASHHVLFAEGALCESLLPGEQAQEIAPIALQTSSATAARPCLSLTEALALLGGDRRALDVPDLARARSVHALL